MKWRGEVRLEAAVMASGATVELFNCSINGRALDLLATARLPGIKQNGGQLWKWLDRGAALLGSVVEVALDRIGSAGGACGFE